MSPCFVVVNSALPQPEHWREHRRCEALGSPFHLAPALMGRPIEGETVRQACGAFPALTVPTATSAQHSERQARSRVICGKGPLHCSTIWMRLSKVCSGP